MAKIDIARMKVGVDFEVNKNNLEELKREITSVRVQLERSASKNGMTESIKQTIDAANNLEKILNSSWNTKLGQLDLSKLNNGLKQTFGTAQNMQKVFAQYPSVYSQFSRQILESNIQLKQSNKLLDKMSITMANTVRFGISSAIFNKMTGALSESYNYVQKLDKSLNNIRIVSGQSANQMNKFAKAANTAAQSLGSSTLDYTNAALIYYQQGLDASSVEKMTDITIRMANVTKDSAEDVSSYMTAIWNNFKDGTHTLEEYADVITALGASTAASSSEIAEGLEKFASVGKTIGLSYEYATSALATVVAQTRQSADTVGTAFKTLFSRIQGLSLGDTLEDGTTLTKYSEALNKVGISIKNQDGSLKDMNDILDEMGSKWSTLNKDQQVALTQTVAGVRQYNQLIALMDNWDSFQKNLLTAQTANGELAKQQDLYLESVEAHLNSLSTEWERTFDTIFDEDAIKSFADVATAALSAVNDYLTGLGGGVNSLATIGLNATNLFSKQIAGGITNSLENSRKDKNSQAVGETKDEFIKAGVLQGHTEAGDALAGTNIDKNAALEKELEYAEKISGVKNILTEKEYQVVTEKQRQIGLLEDEIQKQNELQSNVDKILEENKEVLKSLGIQKDDVEETSDAVENLKSQHQDVTKEISKQEKIIDELTVKFKAEGKTQEEIDRNLEDEYYALNSQKEELKEIESKQKIVNGLAEQQSQIDVEHQESLKAQQEYLGSEIDDVVRLKQEQQNVQTIIQGTTAILSSVTSFKGIISTALDGDLSNWEKFKSITSVLITQMPMLLMNAQSISKLLPAISAQLGIETAIQESLVAAKTKENLLDAEGNLLKSAEIKIRLKAILVKIKETIATWAHIVALAIEKLLTGDVTALGVAAVVAIGAAAVALTAWVVKLVKANSEEAKLKKEVEETNKALSEAKDEYNSLMETVTNYNDAKNSLKDLTEGTVEWYEAIAKANEAAQELIEKWNLVAGKDYTFGSDGLININEDVLSSKQYRSQQEVYRASANSNAAQRDLEKYNQNKIVQSFMKEINRKSNYTVTIDAEQAKTILSNSNNTNTSLGILGNKVDSFQNNLLPINRQGFIDISDSISKYLPQYQASEATINNLEKQQSANLLRGYGTEEDIKAYNAMTETQKNNANKYLATQRKENTNNLKAKDKGFWDYAGDALVNGILNGLTFGTAGTARAIINETENENNKTTAKEAYAKNTLGYKEQNGAWYDENGNSIDYKTIKNIDTATAVKAYNSGEYSTSKSWKDYEDIVINAKNTAYLKGFDETSQNYIADAYTSLKVGEKYDFSLLTNKEKEQVKMMLKPQFSEVKEQKTYEGFTQPFTSTFQPIEGRLQSPYDTMNKKQQSSIYGPQIQEKNYTEYSKTYAEASSDFSTQQIDKWLAASEDAGKSQARLKKDVKEFNDELANQAAALGTTEKALKLYAYANDKASQSEDGKTKATAKSIAEEYKFNKAYNEAIDTFSDSKDAYEKWVKAVKNGGKVSYDVADKVGELQESLEEMTGLELSPDFMANYSDEIKTMLTGTEKEAEAAFNKIQKDAVMDSLQSAYEKIGLTADKAAESAKNLTDKLADIEPGKAIGEDISKELVKLVEDSHMTVDEMENLFANMHLETPPPDSYELEEDSVKTNATSTKHKYDGEIPVADSRQEKGYRLEEIKYEWTETTEPVEQKYVKFKDQKVNFKRDNSSKGSFGKTGSTNFSKSPSSKKSSGSGSSSKSKNTSDEEANKYQQVDTKLKNISTSLSKLQDQESKLLGKDLIANLNSQLQVLNQQIDVTKQKLSIAQNEQSDLVNKLSAYGIKFDADGSINQASYASVFAAEQKKYTNAYSDNEAAKKRWENFKKYIDSYNDLFSSTIPSLVDDIQKALDSQIKIQITKFTAELEIRLNLKEAVVKFNNFKRKIIDGLTDDDVYGAVQEAFDNISSLYSTEVIKELTDVINKEIKELSDPSIYGDNASELMKNLQEHYEKLMDMLIELDDYEKKIIDGYKNMLDQISDEMDDQSNTYEKISNTIEHDMKLIKLINGENSYSELQSYYVKQSQILKDQVAEQRQNMDFFASEMAYLEELGQKDTESWKAARDSWEDATEKWQSSIESAIEKLQEKMVNAINAVFEEINKNLTNNKGLDYLSQEWELIEKNSNEYLDNLNATYKIQQLQTKYLESIDSLDTPLKQQKLNALMEDELKSLREKDKLSQYDLDRADLRYQIALKQIALEEAQQNKTTMRLRRDSQGNYTYQYVADNDQIDKTRQELSDLYNQLYNLDRDKYSESLKNIYDVWTEYQEKMAEAAQINDPEQRAERELLIQKQYKELLNTLTEESENIKFNLQESTFSELFDLYSINEDNYKSMTDEQINILNQYTDSQSDLQKSAYNNLFDLYDKNVENFQDMANTEKDILMNSIVPVWNSGIKTMIDTIISQDGGFGPTMETALGNIKDLTKEYQDEIDDLATSAGIDYEEISSGVDKVITETEKLIKDKDKLLEQYDKEIGAIKEVWNKLDELKDKYTEVYQEAVKASNAGFDALSNELADNAKETEEEVNKPVTNNVVTPVVEPQNNGNNNNNNNNNGLGTASNGAPFIDTYVVQRGDTLSKIGGKYGISWKRIYTENKSVIGSNPNLIYPNQRYKIPKYDTGGYTGDWNTGSGQLAMLHKKELVLNESDTRNMLAAISIIRDINNSMLNRLSAAGGLATGNGLQQNVHIDATFPNVTSSNEIENALNNLVNVASQRVNR